MRASEVTAGAILKMARTKAALTQRELAERAGVSQSVIATYETGAREPALATLSALVEATGVTLELELGTPLASSSSTRGPIGHRLRRRRPAVLALAEQHGVSSIRVFGSVARGEDNPRSDLDLLVTLRKGSGLFALGRFQAELENILGVAVDVVPDDSLKPRFRDNIAKDLVSL